MHITSIKSLVEPSPEQDYYTITIIRIDGASLDIKFTRDALDQLLILLSNIKIIKKDED